MMLSDIPSFDRWLPYYTHNNPKNYLVRFRRPSGYFVRSILTDELKCSPSSDPGWYANLHLSGILACVDYGNVRIIPIK